MKKILLIILLVIIGLLLLSIVFAFIKSLYLYSFKKKRFWASFTDTMSMIFVEIIGEAVNPLHWL